MNFKPMLSADASTTDPSKLHYPLYGSPKLDGIRCIIWGGTAYSRNAKPIRNRSVQAWASGLHNLDGELIVGSPTDPHCLSNTTSGVMAFDGEPDFTFHLLDTPARGRLTFADTLTELEDLYYAGDARLHPVAQSLLHTPADLLRLEESYLMQGYEGLMLRDPQAGYKYGRSTMKEGGLMKLKRFQDGEAVVLSLEEGSVNGNELERDELGRAKRSKTASGLRPSGMVGTLICHSPEWGELRIAPGTMTHADRAGYFKHPAELVGRTVHWRSFGYGVKDLPRFPRYYGIRSDK